MIYMICSSWDIQRNRLKLVILGHLLPFYLHKTPKLKICKTKKFAGYIIILHMCIKNHNHIIYSSWDVEWDKDNFSYFGPFCPFNPLTTWKIKVLKLNKTSGDNIILHICNINDNHMIYGSWEVEHNRHNFCHSGPFFAIFPAYGTRKSKLWRNEQHTWRYYHFINVYHKWQSHDIWFLRYDAWRTEFFVILERFLTFYPANNLKNPNFEKLTKNTWIYYHFTRVCHKWQSNDVWFLRYWARKTDFFVILDHFLLFYPLNNPKYQNFEKVKKVPGDISQKCTKNQNHMLYCSWDMVRDGCNCYFSFWTIFYSFTLLTARKMKISNKWKKHLEIFSFYITAPKIRIRCCTVTEKWCATDKPKKGHIEVGTKPKSYFYVIRLYN